MINNDFKTNENFRKLATGQGDDYTTGCLLDYQYFKENYKIFETDLSKQHASDADPRAIDPLILLHICWICLYLFIVFENVNKTMFFIIEKAKETVLDFLQGPVRVL